MLSIFFFDFYFFAIYQLLNLLLLALGSFSVAESIHLDRVYQFFGDDEVEGELACDFIRNFKNIKLTDEGSKKKKTSKDEEAEYLEANPSREVIPEC